MYAYVGGALLFLALGFGSGWRVHAWKTGADERDRIELERAKDQARQFQAGTASTKYEAVREAAAVRERVITKEVFHVLEKSVYRDVCIDPDGLRILADDIQADAAAGEPRPAVPAASAPG